MKIRESGMPEQELWETFFNPADILFKLRLNNQTNNVVEFGCGYGTFTIPAAKIIKGEIYAFDIDAEMIKVSTEKANIEGLTNVRLISRDFISKGSGLPDESMEYAMLFNILHLKNPKVLLGETNRVLKNGGKLGIIHWNYDSSTPRGPSMVIRPKPDDCTTWAEQAGFLKLEYYDLKPYHYGIAFAKHKKR